MIATVAVAATRLWARSRTLWDWDETLFCLGVRNYDVVLHHPHPPGFPLYIALAKFVRLFVHSDFHALQAIVTLAAMAMFPLLFWLARELRFPVATAMLGAGLFCFLPNVWFFGGTAFSDIAGLALLVAACATLLQGCRSRHAYFAGAVLLGLAAAVRPQALMIGCAPALVASWCRITEKRGRDVLTASAIGMAILAVSYGGAALASQSVDGYLEMNGKLRDYVRHVDSFLSSERPPVISLLPDFFVHPAPGGHMIVVMSILALSSIVISLIRPKPGVWLLAAMFLPFNVFGLFMLDFHSISRYSTGFAPMYAILAVDGIAAAALLAWRAMPPPAVVASQLIVVAAIVVRLVWWTVPALREVRSTPSPPVQTMRWIHENVPHGDKLYVHGSLQAFSDYLLTDYDPTIIESGAELPARPVDRHEWFVTEGATSAIGGRNFNRRRDRLFDIARRRYFEVSVSPLSDLFRFGPGWFENESDGAVEWRWMSGRSQTLLPPLSGNGRLTLAFDIPSELVSRHPSIEIRVNGQIIDRFVCSTPSTTRTWTVPSRANAWNELVISMDRVLNPAKEGISSDSRDLGLELTSHGWGQAEAR